MLLQFSLLVSRKKKKPEKKVEFLENDEPEYIKEESYCAKFCTLKKTCTAYKAISKTLTKEDLERRALEQATINAARRVQ